MMQTAQNALPIGAITPRVTYDDVRRPAGNGAVFVCAVSRSAGTKAAQQAGTDAGLKSFLAAAQLHGAELTVAGSKIVHDHRQK